MDIGRWHFVTDNGFNQINSMNNTIIIDYSLGNVKSVYNAIQYVGGKPVVSDDPESLHKASHLILPGVGAFEDGIKHLNMSGWSEAIKSYITSGKPFLGICLGMQLLATDSTENGLYQGLNLIPGHVVRLEPGDQKLRIPHVGWNDAKLNTSGKLLKGMQEIENFYFVHSYAFIPESQETVVGQCEYGFNFPCILELENIFATQFHPEKSQVSGLKLLENFVGLV